MTLDVSKLLMKLLPVILFSDFMSAKHILIQSGISRITIDVSLINISSAACEVDKQSVLAASLISLPVKYH